MIKEIEGKIKMGKATTEDKIRVDAYYFHRDIIGNIRITSMEEYELVDMMMDVIDQTDIKDFMIMHNIEERKCLTLVPTIKEQLESDMFYMYRSNRDIRTIMENLIKEMCTVDPIERIKEAAAKPMESKENALRINTISWVCDMLGLDHSFDKINTISQEQLLDFVERFKSMNVNDRDEMERLFRIRLRYTTFNIRSAITCLNAIFCYWNGCELSVNVKKTKTRERNTKTRSYIAHIVDGKCQGSSTLALFSRLIKDNRKQKDTVYRFIDDEYI